MTIQLRSNRRSLWTAVALAMAGAFAAAMCGLAAGQRLRVREAELGTSAPPHLYVSGPRVG